MKRLLILLLCGSILSLLHHNVDASFSFDNAFPLVSWYEKGLNAAIIVWHGIDSAKNIDVIIGKCAFARFCFEKMIEDKQQVIDEDIDYCLSLIYSIEEKVAYYYDENGDNYDQQACLKQILLSIKQHLHVPANIKTK